MGSFQTVRPLRSLRSLRQAQDRLAQDRLAHRGQDAPASINSQYHNLTHIPTPPNHTEEIKMMSKMISQRNPFYSRDLKKSRKRGLTPSEVLSR